MASRFQPTMLSRRYNWLMTRLVPLGLPLGRTALLTIPGRRSGEPRTTPVVIETHDGMRWVWSPYGEVDWVKNLRAAGGARVTWRGRTETIQATELDPASAAPLLRRTLATAPSFIRRQCAVTADSPMDDLERAVADHPVFRLD